MCPVMNATEKAWLFRGEGQAVIPCKGKTTEAFQEILQSFSNCSLSQHHYATSVCFPASLHPFISPILPPPTSNKCCEAAPLRQPEIKYRFFFSSSSSSQFKLPKSFRWRSIAQNLLAIQAALAMTSSTSWIICYILPYQHGPLQEKVNVAHFGLVHNTIKMQVALITGGLWGVPSSKDSK